MFYRIASALLILSLMAVAEPLRTLAEIRVLPREQAARHLPVEIEGTVTYFDANAENYGEPEGLVLHDGTAGCYASSTVPFKERERIRPGTRIRVKGVTNPNSYFPNIRQAEVEVLGQGALPEMFLKMAFINNLTVSLGMCNGTYGLNEIMRRARGATTPLNNAFNGAGPAGPWAQDSLVVLVKARGIRHLNWPRGVALRLQTALSKKFSLEAEPSLALVLSTASSTP